MIDIIQLDIDGIHEYQQNRNPYLFLDFADSIIPGVSASGCKLFKDDDWFFKYHFPEDPSVPGALQLEALVQLGALMVLTLPGNKGKIVYLVCADKIKLRKKIKPNDRLEMVTILKTWKRGVGTCKGKGIVNNEIAIMAEFTIAVPDIINQYKIKENV